MRQFNVFGMLICLIIFTPVLASAQSDVQLLEERIIHIEEYLETFQPTLVDFSNKIQDGIESYTKNLESNLSDYSQRMKADLEQQMAQKESRSTVLDPGSTDYQRLETNSGTFLIAVDQVSAVEGGVRLKLMLGNINFADYKDFKLRVFWGARYSGQGSLEQWRSTLRGAEFSFGGVLAKGMWNPVDVDLVPATVQDVGYFECQMEVFSVDLK